MANTDTRFSTIFVRARNTLDIVLNSLACLNLSLVCPNFSLLVELVVIMLEAPIDFLQRWAYASYKLIDLLREDAVVPDLVIDSWEQFEAAASLKRMRCADGSFGFPYVTLDDVFGDEEEEVFSDEGAEYSDDVSY